MDERERGFRQARQDYRTVRSIADIADYLGDAEVVAFDFETSPLPDYREDDRASLDPHRAEITGVSLSVEPGTGVYIPLRHISGGNADVDAVIS